MTMPITIASQLTQRIMFWTAWKSSAIDKKNVIPQFDDDGVLYTIWGYDGPEVLICYIWKGDVPPDVVDGGYTQEQNDADKAAFEGRYRNLCNRSIEIRQPDGVPAIAEAPRDGSEWVIGSHNFCDPCSWFGDSVRVHDETLTDSGDGLTFTSEHVNWIDMVSGRMHNDDIWCQVQMMMDPGDPHGYQVVVKVDGVVQTMREPFGASGGDYEVDWDNGKVIFFASQSGKTVVASYSYATTNTFYVRPMPGKVLIIEEAEADISSDVDMSDAIAYSAWHFDPDTMTYVKDMESKYKRSGQIVTEARGCYPTFEAIGATAADKLLPTKEFRRKSRGMKFNRQAIPFQYSTVKWLRSSYYQEVRVYTEHGRAFDGEHVTMTFYCTEKDEG